MPTASTPVTLSQQIINAACQYFNCTEDQLKTREFVDQRKIVCYLLRTEAMLKLKQIQKCFNLKDHSRMYRQIEEIEAQKNVMRSISTDLKNIKGMVGLCQ